MLELMQHALVSLGEHLRWDEMRYWVKGPWRDILEFVNDSIRQA